MPIWGWRMTDLGRRYDVGMTSVLRRCVALSGACLLAATPAVSGGVSEQTRAVWDAALSRCVSFVEGGDDAMGGWDAMPVRLPGVYSRYDRFERSGDDIAVIPATRDGYDLCRVIRLGDGVKDGSAAPIDRLIFESLLPDRSLSADGLRFAPNDSGVLTSCINHHVYELTPDLVVRTGNAMLRLAPAAISSKETSPC